MAQSAALAEVAAIRAGQMLNGVSSLRPDSRGGLDLVGR